MNNLSARKTNKDLRSILAIYEKLINLFSLQEKERTKTWHHDFFLKIFAI